ncbi:MAG: type II toxin-antitoxin system VapC family toxin [Chloroflexi bacterium]|nr:type II toxin-antitoxin system VapC family toxin [Chloroflexota bacterium]
MIVYLDASALVKRYIAEDGSPEVNALITQADSTVTNLISRAEVAAAIMRASRMEIINREDALQAIKVFRSEWENLQRLPVTEATVARADSLIRNYDLRGYDAVHMAAALIWQEAIVETITMATYDHNLWNVARKVGLDIWPDHLKS